MYAYYSGIVFLWLFLLVPALVSGQVRQNESYYPTGRPKVGLALSGGGAKGLAHIGVLRVMEEVGLRPDYLTGTSMGSVVGGLYALGYSADSLASIVRAQDWDLLLSDDLPLQEVVFEEKEYFNNEFLELPVDGWSLQAPSGVVEGQQIMELLTKLTLPAYHIDDFAQLPIPFQCMGADVVSGRNIPLTKGRLARAMRASMAIPTVFTAVIRDSMVLIDGGFIRNFPVEELEKMGAQHMIGSYTGAFRKTPKELLSFGQILGQLAFLQSIDDAQKQLPLLDIYIEPDLSEYSAADFNKYEAIMAAGEKAAREKIDELRTLARELDALGKQPPRPTLSPLQTVTIDSIAVMGSSGLSATEIKGRIGINPGDRVAVDTFIHIVENLYGTNLFNHVSYDLLQEAGRTILKIDAREKLNRILKTSLLYDSYSNAGFLFSFTQRQALLPADRLMFIGRITDNYRARLNYLKYLDRERTLSVFLDWSFHTDRVPILQQGVEQNEYRMTSRLLNLLLQKRYGTNVQLFAGLELERLGFVPRSGPDALVVDDVDAQQVNVKAGLDINTLDRNIFPTRGVDFALEGSLGLGEALRIRTLNPTEDGLFSSTDTLLNNSNFGRIRLSVNAYLPINDKLGFRFSPFLGMIFNVRSSLSDFFLLGGPQSVSRRSVPFYGLDSHELNVQTVIGLHLGYQYFLRKNLVLMADVNGAFLANPNVLRQSGIADPDVFLAGAQFGIGYETIVGPVQFSVMYPLDSADLVRAGLRTYFSFGYRF